MSRIAVSQCFLSLLRSLVSSHSDTHGLRRGLHSFAASRLGSCTSCQFPAQHSYVADSSWTHLDFMEDQGLTRRANP